MKFMCMVRATKESEGGAPPDAEIINAMGKFNEELVKAGVLLAGEGLHPSSKGARVKYSGDKRTVVDGPFAETKELIAGFWILELKSKEEAVEWMMRCPAPFKTDCEIEIRQVFGMDDFPFTDEAQKQQEAALREKAKAMRR